MTHEAVKQHVADYYSKKLEAYGLTPQGVDWNSSESQFLRFRQLLRGFDINPPFSVADYGCGYGALVDYLTQLEVDFRYVGYDISEAMIHAAKAAYAKRANVAFSIGDHMGAADYVVASGIFNVRMGCTDQQWEDYIRAGLLRMNQASTQGFSFNILTAYSDPPLRRPDLYYADPCFWFDWCKHHCSKNVALFHDYNLYEFTISVLKSKD